MTYRLAIARNRFVPTVIDYDYPTAEDAIRDMDKYWRESLRGRLVDAKITPRFAPHYTGDYCVVPSEAAPDRGGVSSLDIRKAAVATTRGRDWRTAFTTDELTQYAADMEDYDNRMFEPL